MTVLASSTSALDQPGTLAFLVIFGLCVVSVLLFRSMTKHLRKVRNMAREEAARSSTSGKENEVPRG